MDDMAIDSLTSVAASELTEHTHAAQCLTQQLTTFLLARPNLDEICQYCVLDLLAPLRPWQMSIYSVGKDSLFRHRGSFGRSPGQGSLHEHSCLDDFALGEQLRHGLPLANFPLPTVNAGEPTAISELNHGPQVLWPLTTMQRLVGIIQVQFTSVPEERVLVAALSAIAAPVALALDIATPQNRRAGDSAHVAEVRVHTPIAADHQGLAHPSGSSANGQTPHEEPATDHLTLVPPVSQLTPRQHRVLELMAKGMTNGQIARVLAFSESTVRQETMAIYRVLQVPGRTEAVAAGRELGLLPGADRG
jgi:DNA-binding CsgD family transcriptional regulator